MKDLQKWLFNQATRREQTWNWSFFDRRHITAPYYVPAAGQDRTLVFESRFESGNLALAVKLSDFEYKLVLQNDSLTKGNTQCNRYAR